MKNPPLSGISGKEELHNKKNPAWLNQLKNDEQTRVFFILCLLLAGFLTILLVNNVVSHIDTKTWSYVNPKVIPAYPPIGNDFRVGYYWPAKFLISSHFSAIGAEWILPQQLSTTGGTYQFTLRFV